jgi:hypothetical protein
MSGMEWDIHSLPIKEQLHLVAGSVQEDAKKMRPTQCCCERQCRLCDRPLANLDTDCRPETFQG